jgi:hypothetical protein
LYHHPTNEYDSKIKLENPGASSLRFCGSKVVVCGWNAKIYLYDKNELICAKMEHRKQCRYADFHIVKLKGKEIGVLAVGSEDTLISVWKIT